MPKIVLETEALYQVFQVANGDNAAEVGYGQYFRAVDGYGKFMAYIGEPRASTGIEVVIQSRWVASDDGMHAIEKFRRWLASGEPEAALL